LAHFTFASSFFLCYCTKSHCRFGNAYFSKLSNYLHIHTLARLKLITHKLYFQGYQMRLWKIVKYVFFSTHFMSKFIHKFYRWIKFLKNLGHICFFPQKAKIRRIWSPWQIPIGGYKATSLRQW
jgi:hypothetical protein